jgi:hypothetical protein
MQQKALNKGVEGDVHHVTVFLVKVDGTALKPSSTFYVIIANKKDPYSFLLKRLISPMNAWIGFNSRDSY